MEARLNKFIADCTEISRRKADELIRDGQVTVNGKPATIGQTINPEKDRVSLKGKPLQPQRKMYVAFYKPAGYITSRSDPEGRKTIYDVLPEKYHHLDPVGRLDRESSGLLLLTNDGDFMLKLTHPRYEHQKTYRVRVDKPLTPEVLEKLEAGILLQPEKKLAKQLVQSIEDHKIVVLMLKTGMNRQIRRSFEALGYEVTSLKRISLAGFNLGSLRPGQTRELRPSELRPYLAPQGKARSPARHKKRAKH